MHSNKRSKTLAMAVALLAVAACNGDDNLPGDNIPPPGMNPVVGDTVAITNTNGTFNVVTFNRATPTTLSTPIPITGLAAGDVIVGADIRPADGNFYAVTKAADGSGKVYTINTSTGAAGTPVTLLSSMGMGTTPTILTGDTFGVDFNPVPDRLRITSNTGQNLRINLGAAAGAVTTTVDGNLVLNTGGTPGVVEVGYRLSFAATCNTTLYYLDTTTDRLLITSDPNGGTVRAVGTGLGVGDVTAVGGFEIMTTGSGPMFTDTALALLTVNGTTALYTIDLLAGTATISPAGNFGSGTTFVGLGISPPPTPTAQPRGNLVAVTENNALISFNTGGSPAKLCTQPVAITGLQTGENVLDIDVRPATGMVYGVTDQSRIYIIDPNSGVATSPIALTNSMGGAPVVIDPMAAVGIDFNPVPDRLRIVTDTGQNLRVNVDPAAAAANTIVDGILSTMPIATMGRINDVDVTAVAYTNALNGTPTTRLFNIDVLSDTLFLQNPPNDGTSAMGVPLGVDAERAVGFDINGLTNQAFAGLNLPGATATGFYNIAIARPGDTGTPPATAATLVGNIAGGAKVRGFAIVNSQSQASQATVLAMTDANQLVTFAAANPTVFTSTTAVTGLNASEIIVGLDQRPSNGVVYAVTNQGRLLTINPATGATTPVGMSGALTPMMGDDNPFTALRGTMTFGVDVNPLPDRLRVVSESLENLRINMDNGVTITDTDLTRTDMVMGAPVLSAVAYSNNSANVSGVSLFGIDQATNTLQRFVNANGGTLTTVGSLGMTAFTNVASFDIVGGDNTFALAAFQPMAMAQSQLFLVNLGTGAASPQPAMGNTVGPMGTVITSATVLLTQLP